MERGQPVRQLCQRNVHGGYGWLIQSDIANVRHVRIRCAPTASYLLLTSGDEGRARPRDPGTRWARGPHDEQRYMHLSPAATEDAIRLLDERLAGVETVEKFGDILETGSAATGSSSAGMK
jgi:hypothetical protein